MHVAVPRSVYNSELETILDARTQPSGAMPFGNDVESMMTVPFAIAAVERQVRPAIVNVDVVVAKRAEIQTHKGVNGLVR
jgi:hypothetical protein